MGNKVSFRTYLRDTIGSRRPTYSYLIPFDYAVMSILTDKTFPDDETDGLEVKRYIREKQRAEEVQIGTETACEYNEYVLYHFERLWKKYKDYLNPEKE